MRDFTARKWFVLALGLMSFVFVSSAFADVDPEGDDSSRANQFPQTEVAPVAPMAQASQAVNNEAVADANAANQAAAANSQNSNFPKVQNKQDEELAKRFSWWPTDAKPAPVKDPDRSGYWWWPDVPGQARPWGNQGFVYVRKVIFDYKTSEGELKPSLVIKKILKNVRAYFDYDKSDIRDDAADLLTKAVYTLEKNPNTDVLITGNADIRGSEKYNLKLGEKRAAAVRQWLLDHNISDERIKILSRGKMDALAPANDIVGMQKDRNAQFMVAEVEEVMIPASQAPLYQDKVIEEKEELEGAIKVDTKDYVIQSGDTLWGIAKREYGDGRQWKRIYEFNKDVIADANKPRKGTKIKIPIE